MAQSSNYKQYTRATRVLTEESGFSGGMLWTGNNIDETHLKAIVNCDYDDTTGYIKTRGAFEQIDENEIVPDIDLRNYRLLGTYNICAFDKDENTTDAGWLYIFAKPHYDKDVWYADFDKDSIVCLFRASDTQWHNCDLSRLPLSTVQLHNVNRTQLLTLYDNYLYGIGSDATTDKAWLHVYHLQYTTVDDADVYELCYTSVEEVKAKADSVTLLEACTTGFNAAREDAFRYSGKPTESKEQAYIQGLYLKDEAGNYVISPRTGHKYTINIIADYYVKDGNDVNKIAVFELKKNSSENEDTNDLWQHLANVEPTVAADGNKGLFVYEWECKQKSTTLMLTHYGLETPFYKLLTREPGDFVTSYDKYYKKQGEDYVKLTTSEEWYENNFYTKLDAPEAYSSAALDYLGPYVITANDNIQNLKIKNYDLSSAVGNCIWKNRMCLWGTNGSNNCLFLSEVDNFFYYPMPHNVAIFDTNVISCIPYKDTLLVFTADKIYRMSENNDGSFTQAVIQNDMPLSKSDAAQLVAIKNMVLFKSGNYFYMIVPKAQSLTDELSIAPIYKNIAGFLNTLDKSVLDVLQLLYPEYYFKNCEVSNKGNPVTVYSEQDTVHILYEISTIAQTKPSYADKYMSFKLFLNYNTNLRAWTLYIEDVTQQTLEPASLTTERRMSFVRITNNTGKFSIATKQNVSEFKDAFRILLDTGYRTLASATQKRFREVQLKLYSSSENITEFGTSFLVDGVWRRNYVKLQEVSLSEDTVSLMPELDLNTFATELTQSVDELGEVRRAPGSDAIELSDWTLDFSHFKREAPVTIRIPVSGKGFNPRFILMAPVNTELTINEINWVYRLMHGR